MNQDNLSNKQSVPQTANNLTNNPNGSMDINTNLVQNSVNSTLSGQNILASQQLNNFSSVVSSTSQQVNNPSNVVSSIPQQVNNPSNVVSSTPQQVNNPSNVVSSTPQQVNNSSNVVGSTPQQVNNPSNVVSSIPQQVSNTSNSVSSTSINSTVNSSSNINDSKEKEHEVVEILSSSSNGKEKVNLLTPEQKEELIKKHEAAILEKEKYQPVEVSKFRKAFMFIFLVGIIGMTFFLPEINALLGQLNDTKQQENEKNIVTGTLRCTKKNIDDKYNIDYTYSFDFENSNLKKLSYYEVITGDQATDSDELGNKFNSCQLLKESTGQVGGINVNCSLADGVLTREQVFDYTTLDSSAAVTAYTEAGGEYPGQFSLDSDINSIETNMKTDGYTCSMY